MDRLSEEQIQQFIRLGYVKVEKAFPKSIADSCRSLLWKELQLSPDKPESWTTPVIRIGSLDAPPFRKAANTPILLHAFEQLAGDNWLPLQTMGSFPIRFPGEHRANDKGWHVDASFTDNDTADFFEWKINIYSTGRALLMLFLFSDVTDLDAPTRIMEESHVDVANILRPEGKAGLTFTQLARQVDSIPKRNIINATGKAGTVYLCHPFLVHAAQDHFGTNPKFMAQPPLLAKRDFQLNKEYDRSFPIEKAIRDKRRS